MTLDAKYRKSFKKKNTALNEENESPVRWFEDQQAMKGEREVVQRRKQSKAQCTLQLREGAGVEQKRITRVEMVQSRGESRQ